MNPVQKKAINLFFGNLKEITTNQVHWHKDTNTFSEEASTLDIPPGEVFDSFHLLNPKTGNFRIFTYSRTIMTDSGEDIGGWEYTTQDNNLKLIIWND